MLGRVGIVYAKTPRVANFLSTRMFGGPQLLGDCVETIHTGPRVADCLCSVCPEKLFVFLRILCFTTSPSWA